MCRIACVNPLVPGLAVSGLLILLQAVLTVTAATSECTVVTFFGLKTAECDNRNLVKVPANMARDIKVLKFNDNQLTYLKLDEFKHYPQLQEIYLQRNRIDMIAQDAFRGLYNVQILNLEANKLTEVPTKIFDHLISIRILRMSGNPIRYITANAFAKLRNIEEINFENCWLERVDPKSFHGLSRLNEINLVNNELSTLSAEMRYSLPSTLTIFRLYRNPWVCDCRLRWLRRWIDEGDVNWDFSSNTPACSGPQLLQSISWKFLKEDQFACPAKIVGNSSTSMELEVGGNTTILCKVTGDPEPKIAWLKGARYINEAKVLERFSVVDGMKFIHSSIVLNEVRKGDAGDYKCIAENSAGRSEVTYKLWVQGEDPAVGAATTIGLGTEAILGIAIGSALLIILLIVCAVFCFRRQERNNHSYQVRDYKKAPKGVQKDSRSCDEEEEAYDSGKEAKEKDKTVPTASTELLCDKSTSEKEKEILQDLGELVPPEVTSIPGDNHKAGVADIRDEPDLHVGITIEPPALNGVGGGGNKHEPPPPLSPLRSMEPIFMEPVTPEVTPAVISRDLSELSPDKSEPKSPNEFKMRIFSTYDHQSDGGGGGEPRGQRSERRDVVPPGGGEEDTRMTPIPPPPPRPLCNSHIKDLPPDLLRDERHQCAKPPAGGATYPNHILHTTHKRAEENPYAKPSDLKPAAKRHSSSQENLLGNGRGPRDYYGDGKRDGGGSRGVKPDQQHRGESGGTMPRCRQQVAPRSSREPSPCTNPVCLANHRHGGDSRSATGGHHCGKPHIKPSRSMEGFHKLEGMLEEEGSSPHRSRDDVRGGGGGGGYGASYRTLPSRPMKKQHSHSPSKSVTIADPYCYPSATVGLDSPTKSAAPPMLRHYAASPQKPGSGRTLPPPILKSSSGIPGTRSPPSASSTLPHHHPGGTGGKGGPGSRSVGFAEPAASSAYSSPHKPPRTFGTSLDDLLSPPFGNIAADRSKPNKHKPKPGDKDDFGTAV